MVSGNGTARDGYSSVRVLLRERFKLFKGGSFLLAASRMCWRLSRRRQRARQQLPAHSQTASGCSRVRDTVQHRKLINLNREFVPALYSAQRNPRQAHPRDGCAVYGLKHRFARPLTVASLASSVPRIRTCLSNASGRCASSRAHACRSPSSVANLSH